MHRRTQNKHWKDLLHNEAQGKCMRCVRRVSRAHSCSVADSSDADDEGSSREDATVDEGGSGSSNEDTAVDEDSTSSSEDTTAELSNESFSSSSEESDDDSSQQPRAASQTPPLGLPASPSPYEAVSDNWFNMEGDNQQSDYISGWYTTEEEVRSLLFNVLD
jgi:hypothetical protein